jgi:hypothetical protein
MATEFNNSIRYPPTLIDFDDDVGITGQAHDTYPAGGQQPRWDWMRITLIGLLSLQSSKTAPTQYRTGTPWFDKNTDTIKIWSGTDWEPISKFIGTGTDTDTDNLYNTLNDIQSRISSVLPTAIFSGSCTKNTTRIKVPDSVNTLLSTTYTELRPLVYKNGLLVDPRRCSLSPSCPLYIDLVDTLIVGDTFTVIIQHFDGFVTDTVYAS